MLFLKCEDVFRRRHTKISHILKLEEWIKDLNLVVWIYSKGQAKNLFVFLVMIVNFAYYNHYLFRSSHLDLGFRLSFLFV